MSDPEPGQEHGEEQLLVMETEEAGDCYAIVEGVDPSHLAENVNIWMNSGAGWKPVGGVAPVRDPDRNRPGGWSFHQAVVRVPK